jgi:hypothetical protein
MQTLRNIVTTRTLIKELDLSLTQARTSLARFPAPNFSTSSSCDPATWIPYHSQHHPSNKASSAHPITFAPFLPCALHELLSMASAGVSTQNTQYDKIGTKYNSMHDLPAVQPEEPSVRAVLGDVQGLRCLGTLLSIQVTFLWHSSFQSGCHT